MSGIDTLSAFLSPPGTGSSATQKSIGGLPDPRKYSGPEFNPAGTDYDYATAIRYGMGADGTGTNKGHWGSVAPADDAERLGIVPAGSYLLLKGLRHPTFMKGARAEIDRGSSVVKRGSRWYSIPGED